MGRESPSDLEYAQNLLTTTILLGRGLACPWEEQCTCRRRPTCPLNNSDTYNRAAEYMLCDGEGFGGQGRSPPCNVRRAIEVVTNSYLARARVSKPPVPTSIVGVIDEDRGVEIRELPLKAYHGGVWLVEKKWVIQLKAVDPLEEKRYTLFHEAFHIICRTICPAFKKVDLDYKGFNEMLADYFAACLLMPKKWLGRYWHREQDAAKMAQIFQVPEYLMRLWLLRTGISAPEELKLISNS